MLRKFTLFLILLATVFQLMAQQANSLSIGFKLMPGTTKLLPYAEGGSYRLAMGFGLKTTYITNNPAYGIETGIYILDKGSSLKEDIYNLDGNFYNTDIINSHFYYVIVPFLFKYNYQKVYANAGLTLEYFLTGYTSSELLPTKEKIEFYGDVNLGAMLNIGYQNNFGKRLSYFAEIYFNPVLTDIKRETESNFLNYGVAMGMQYFLSSMESN